eukprot:364500-Chlamydomonas_euryale.AAC.29
MGMPTRPWHPRKNHRAHLFTREHSCNSHRCLVCTSTSPASTGAQPPLSRKYVSTLQAIPMHTHPSPARPSLADQRRQGPETQSVEGYTTGMQFRTYLKLTAHHKGQKEIFSGWLCCACQ